MSHEAINWALSCRVGDGNRKLVLYGLANHAHKNGRNAYAGKATLAEYAEVDKRTVVRILRRLQEDGFVRLGDQRIVEHIRADRRPNVYDLAMSEETRVAWAEAFARGDEMSPREDLDLDDSDAPRGDAASPRPRSALSPRSEGHGVTDPAARGDKAVSPEPNTNQSPVAPDDSTASPATGCPAHLEAPHASCRSCGTSTRAARDAAREAAAARKRTEDREAIAQARAARAVAGRARQSPTTQAAIAAAKDRIRGAKQVPVGSR